MKRFIDRIYWSFPDFGSLDFFLFTFVVIMGGLIPVLAGIGGLIIAFAILHLHFLPIGEWVAEDFVIVGCSIYCIFQGLLTLAKMFD